LDRIYAARVELHDLDRADELHKRISTQGYSVEELAKKVNKGETFIRDLLRMEKVPEVASQAFRNGEISKSICVLISPIPDEKQRAQFVKELLTGGQDGGPMSVRQAKEWKEQHYMKDLRGAPFPLDDATLDPEWGSTCTKGSCPHWNGNTPGQRQGKRPNICLNADHYTKLVRLNAVRVIANIKNPTG
jgi:hypothetical protein